MTPDAALPARTLIVEDIAATRDWLSGLVHQAFPATGVYHAASLAEARGWAAGNPGPGDGLLFLVDLGLPDGTGVDLIREWRQRYPAAQLVVSTIYDDDAHLMQAMAAGAQSYLLKDRPAEEIVELLRRIGRGEVALSPPMARRLLDHFRAHAAFVTAGAAGAGGEERQLTGRETEVLRLIGRGLTLAEAGAALAISAQTVATHVKAIYRKLGITSRAEAALEAARRNLT
ncbi:MAG: response regulator transcription factor [Sphingomonadales bacterium]|nr:response regulator transcription factor [Sphingomonadales bacterium]